jgi:hypothetical protein
MSIIYTLVDPSTMVAAEGVTDWLNGKIADWTTVVKGASVLGGIGIAFFAGLKGKGRLPAVIMGIIVGALFIWGVIAGVDWFKVKIEGETQVSTASRIQQIEVAAPESQIYLRQ